MRSPVTVVVVASSPRSLPGCLPSLQATVGVRDEILLVVPAPAVTRAPGRVSVVPVEPGTDFERCRDLGRQQARHDLVVLLDGDTLLPAHWLDPLVAALADPTVAAAVPRSNRVAGPQFVPDTTYGERRAAVNDFARVWQRDHRGRVSDVADLSALSGLCLALRRTASAPATRHVVVHDSYVHHEGGPDCLLLPAPDEDPAAPLLSASLIVKDEEDVIEGCIAALTDLCDEVVVYDTGSTDRTRELAAASGARVVEGYWDDSFGAARNRSMEHCHGRWVLGVDADETVVADVAATRAALLAAGGNEGFEVTVRNTTGLGTGAVVEITSCRIWRRDTGRFVGRIHEQLVHRVLGRPLEPQDLAVLRVDHRGYEEARVLLRDKGTRNLRLSEAAAADLEISQGLDVVLANLARSQLAAGAYAEAMETLGRLAKLESPRPLVLRAVGASAVPCYIAFSRYEEAWDWVERVRATDELPERVEALALRVLAGEGRHEEALARLQALPEQAGDAQGLSSFRRMDLADLEVRLLLQLGRAEEAVAPLLAAVRKSAVNLHVGEQLAVFRSAGRPVEELVAAYSPEMAAVALTQAVELPPDLADVLLEVLWRRDPGDASLYAVCAVVSRGLPVARANEWSKVLRGAGLARRCPLLHIAAQEDRSARDRLLAAAVAVEAYDDERALPLLYIAADEVPDDEAGAALDELRLVAPRVAEAMEVAGA